jgi:N utilization substance protein B
MDEDLITNPKWSQRRQNRATAFRFIFQWEMNPSDDLNRDLMDFINRLGKDEGFYNYAIELVDGIVEKKDIIDSMIKELVDNWDFSRIAKADLSLLRVAIYEIQYRLDIPPVVVIDETLEISKEFSTENSKKFLNGVLDKFISNIKRPSRKPAI